MGRLKALGQRVQTLNTQRRPSLTTSSTRTRGGSWMDIRTRILRRDRGLCCMCSRAGLVSLACDVDHRVELDDGGTDDDGNLWSLCRLCHLWKTRVAATARRDGLPLLTPGAVDLAVADRVSRLAEARHGA